MLVCNSPQAKKVGEANLLIKINDAKRFSSYVSVDNQATNIQGVTVWLQGQKSVI